MKKFTSNYQHQYVLMNILHDNSKIVTNMLSQGDATKMIQKNGMKEIKDIFFREHTVLHPCEALAR
jgi:hypothetical protein